MYSVFRDHRFQHYVYYLVDVVQKPGFSILWMDSTYIALGMKTPDDWRRSMEGKYFPFDQPNPTGHAFQILSTQVSRTEDQVRFERTSVNTRLVSLHECLSTITSSDPDVHFRERVVSLIIYWSERFSFLTSELRGILELQNVRFQEARNAVISSSKVSYEH